MAEQSTSTSINEEFLIELGEDYFIKEDLDTFLLQNYSGKIVKLTRENLNELKRPLVVAFHNFEEDCHFLKDWTDRLYATALKYEGRIQYAIADFKNVSLVNYRLESYCGQGSWRAWLCGIDEKNRKYKSDFYVFDNFSEKLLKGELYRSEALPAQNDALVKVAVADNYEELVVKSDKDVFVLIYYADSYSSEDLVSRLDDVAELLRDENILIVKMNDVNYYPIEYDLIYPKCLYFTRTDKSKFIHPKSRIRSAEDLIKFIASNSSEELRDYDRKEFLKH